MFAVQMDLATAIELRDAAKTAYLNALDARSATDGDRAVQRHDIAVLRAEYERWERTVNQLSQPAAYGRPTVAIARWTR